MFRDDNPIFEFRGPFGVPVQIGASLFLLVLFYFYSGGSDPVWTLIFIALVLLSIFLHELGHAWACLIQGVPVRRIMLYGGGGFCERMRSATAYEQEFIVAMGPIVNMVLWAVFSLLSNAMWDNLITQAATSGNPQALLDSPQATAAHVFRLFAMINGFLVVFNLIPVQPLDGGKLLHLVLLRLVRPDIATVTTGAIGLAISIVWIPAMLLAYGFGYWILFFIPSIPLHWSMMKQRVA